MCKAEVVVMITKYGRAVTVTCGKTWAGEMHMCPSCEAKALITYPQGWKYVPGDLCQHGHYVGGMLEDNMCPECEMDEDDKFEFYSDLERELLIESTFDDDDDEDKDEKEG